MTLSFVNPFELQILVDLCETGSFRAVARRHGIGSAAVSKIIRGMEAQWQLELVQSSGNAVSITEKARQLASLSTELLNANSHFLRHLAAIRGEWSTEPIRIGSGGSNTRVVMTQLVEFLLNHNPQLRFEVITTNSEEVTNAIIAGTLDYGVVSGHVSDALDKELLLHDTISLYAHKDNPLLAAPFELSELNVPICFREKGSSTRKAVEQFLFDQDIQLRNISQTGKNDELTAALSQSQNALQFMSDYFFRQSKWQADYRRLAEAAVEIPIPLYFVTRQHMMHAGLREQARAFANALKELQDK